MSDLYFQVYCLSCHRVMREPGPVCDRCGAVQEEVRQQLLAPPVPQPTGIFRIKRLPPPLPPNALETAACPTCKVPVPAGAPSCPYCGHRMLNDIPGWASDEQVGRRYGLAGIVCAVIGLLCLPVSLFLSGFLVLAGLLLAFIAHGENPFGWSTTILLGAMLSVAWLFVIVMVVLMFMGAHG